MQQSEDIKEEKDKKFHFSLTLDQHSKLASIASHDHRSMVGEVKFLIEDRYRELKDSGEIKPVGQ